MINNAAEGDDKALLGRLYDEDSCEGTVASRKACAHKVGSVRRATCSRVAVRDANLAEGGAQRSVRTHKLNGAQQARAGAGSLRQSLEGKLAVPDADMHPRASRPTGAAELVAACVAALRALPGGDADARSPAEAAVRRRAAVAAVLTIDPDVRLPASQARPACSRTPG